MKRKLSSSEETPNKLLRTNNDTTALEYLKEISTGTTSTFSDITVKTKHKNYELHRIMLNRSSYFQNIFSGNWSENSNQLDLTVVEEDAFNGELTTECWDCLFEFLYSGTVDLSVSLKTLISFFMLARYFDVLAGIDEMLDEMTPYRQLVLLDVLDQFDEIVENSTRIYIPIAEVLLQFILDCQPVANNKTYRREQDSDDFDERECQADELGNDLSDTPTSFIKKLMKVKLLPLPFKVSILYLWIKHKLKIDPDKDSAWRSDDGAAEFVDVVDSLDLVSLEQLSSDHNLFKNTEELNARHNQLDKFQSCCIYVEHEASSCSDEESNTYLVDHKLHMKCTCGERSSAYWWVIGLHNQTELPLSVTLVSRAQYGIDDTKRWEISKATLEPNEEIEEIQVLYGPQFDNGGVSASLLFLVEKVRVQSD